MNSNLISQVISSLTMNAHSVEREIDKNGEVENLFFYQDKSKEEYIRLNFQFCPIRKKSSVIIQWSKTVELDDDTGAITCSRMLDDWSDYILMLTVAKAEIDLCC